MSDGPFSSACDQADVVIAPIMRSECTSDCVVVNIQRCIAWLNDPVPTNKRPQIVNSIGLPWSKYSKDFAVEAVGFIAQIGY